LADVAFDSILNPPTLVKTPGFIKRLINRLSFKFRRYLVNKRIQKFYSSRNGIAIDDRAALAIKALEAALKDPKNTLLIAPTSGSRYIQTPNANVFIILKYQTIILSNHQYYYEIALSGSVSEYLTDRFDKMIESRRRQMEKKMLENSKATLEAAVSTLQQKMLKNTAKRFTQL
jgi:predicted O-linked N-acetylglucosamine transferase (SPINDLY family)